MFTGLIEEIGTVRRIERGAKGARPLIGSSYKNNGEFGTLLT